MTGDNHDSGDDPVIDEIGRELKADILSAGWRQRLVTMLLTTGVLAFGFMLGVHYFAAATFNALPPLTQVPEYAPLQETYNFVMKAGLFVSGGSLIAGVALELGGRDDD